MAACGKITPCPAKSFSKMAACTSVMAKDVQWAGPARLDGVRAGTARRIYRAVPRRAPCLTYGPGTACWAIYRAGPAREARPVQRVGPARAHDEARAARERGKGRKREQPKMQWPSATLPLGPLTPARRRRGRRRPWRRDGRGRELGARCSGSSPERACRVSAARGTPRRRGWRSGGREGASEWGRGIGARARGPRGGRGVPRGTGSASGRLGLDRRAS